MKTACGYARVSDPEKAEKGYSLGEQRAQIERYCREHGYQLVEYFEDGGLSGKLSERPGLLEIRKLAEQTPPPFEVLILLNSSRLYRTYWRAQQLSDWFRSRGVRVEYVQHASGNTPAERLAEGVQGVVAEFEWARIRQLTMDARYAKARSGKAPNAMRAFGYHTITVAEAAVLAEYRGRDGELIPLEPEAEIVRDLYRRVAEGESLHSLCVWLNERDIRGKKGGPWYVTSLRLLLQNPLYIGRYRYGWRHTQMLEETTRSGRSKIKRTLRAEGEWVEIAVPPLVEQSVWERAQERITAAGHIQRGRPSSEWPLKGIVFCAHCTSRRGEPLRCIGWRKSNCRRSVSYVYRMYVCGTRSRTDLPYCGVRINARELEKMAHQALRRASRPGTLAKQYAARAKALRKNAGGAVAEVERLRSELAGLDAEERKCADLVFAGISAHIVRERVEKLHLRRTVLQADLGAAEKRAGELIDPEEAAEAGRRREEWLREQLKAAEGRPDLLRELCVRVLRITLSNTAAPDIQVLPFALPE